MNRRIYVAIVALALFACQSSATSPLVAGTVHTVLSGSFYDALLDHPRTVVVYDWRNGRAGDELCSTESDRGGQWSCDLGPLSGELLVEVEEERNAGLRAVVDSLGVGEARSVEITPVTTLVAAYTEALEVRGLAWPNALRKARSLIDAHFGDLDHSNVHPAHLDRDVTRVSDAATAAVLLAGFEALADREAAKSGLGHGGLVNTWSLVSALSADIEADGVFDGQGRGGQIRLASAALDGDTLRAEYGRAILEWLGSPTNPTGLRASDFEALAHAMATDKSEIFPPTIPAPLADHGPMITRFVLHAGSRELGPSDPAKGDVIAELSATATAAITRMDIALDGETSPAFALVEGHPGYRMWRIAGGMLFDGEHQLRASVGDAEGNEAAAGRSFVVDNTAPVLTATAAGIADGPSIRVHGTVMDAIGPVQKIDFDAGGAQATIASPAEMYEGTIVVPCNATWPIHVRAEDAAGNVATATVAVRCDSAPPVIGWRQSLFREESALDAVYSADGSSLAYAWQAGVTPVRLDASAVSTIAKYFTRLDLGADNLPTYRFFANDAEGGVRVDYRYLHNSQERRSWTPLAPVTRTPAAWEFELPVSYQTLDPTLANGMSADLHRIELRATDDAGNQAMLAAEFHVELRSPPVWFGRCALDPAISSYTLPAANLGDLYRQARPGVFEGQFRYALDLPPGSLAPSAGAFVQFTSGAATSRVTELSEDRHDGASVSVVPSISIWCYPNLTAGTTRLGADFDHLGACADPKTPVEEVRATAAAGASLNDIAMHTVALEAVSHAGAVLPMLGADEFVTPPDALSTLTGALEHPAIAFAGAPYVWDTSFSVPSGFTARTVPPRYRVPHFDRVGWNYEWLRGTTFNAYPFVTRAYVSAFELEVAPVVVGARHQVLLEVPVGVQVAPECTTALVYATHL